MEDKGIILVNKPVGMTSHDVVNVVRRLTGEKRVGHAGTLDPLADGLLIVLVGRENTRRQSEFLGLDKEYVAEVTFGAVSETYDAEGPFRDERDTSGLTEAAVQESLADFLGEIEQTPPVHSAIKVGGKKLYREARAGRADQLVIPKRQVTVFEAELLEFTPGEAGPDGPGTSASARLRFHVSKGTYIRSLAHDLGQALGVGAFLSGLTRTRIGEFSLEEAVTLEELESRFVKG